MVALTIRTRSRVARKRPNKVAVGRMLTVAVFGMFILWWGGDARTINSLRLIYVYQIPMATRLFAWQHARHCNAAYEGSTDSKGRPEAAFAHSRTWLSSLFRRLLARWVKGAGVVDVGDLVIAEAEHLAQDFVGVLAEQRRAGYLARAVRELDRVADRQVFAAGGVIHLDHGAG